VSTTNGVERQHEYLKYSFLTDMSGGSLTELVVAIVQKLVPASERKYVTMSYKCKHNFYTSTTHLQIQFHVIEKYNIVTVHVNTTGSWKMSVFFEICVFALFQIYMTPVLIFCCCVTCTAWHLQLSPTLSKPSTDDGWQNGHWKDSVCCAIIRLCVMNSCALTTAGLSIVSSSLSSSRQHPPRTPPHADTFLSTKAR